MHRRVKELVLRKFDDTGADTLEKYWAQFEYTAYWCVHLLIPRSGIMRVIPEGVDDVTLVKDTCYELHQVKCRDESQPPWTTADILPIICSQYARRSAFGLPCQYYFVSDHLADNRTQLRPRSYGQLFRLKFLLDIEHDGQLHTPEEIAEFEELEGEILPRIVELMKKKGEDIDTLIARKLLHNTHIKTNSPFVRDRPSYEELANAFLEALPGHPPLDIIQLSKVYSRLLFLIINKIIAGKSLEERTITRDDVLACRAEAIVPEAGLPDLDKLPGNTIAEKKAGYGGFDLTDFPVIALQMKRTDEKKRGLEIFGLNEKLEDLTLALITLQADHRRYISQSASEFTIGPSILREIQPDLRNCINLYLPNIAEVDSPFCRGLLWWSTNECHIWWHRIGAETLK